MDDLYQRKEGAKSGQALLEREKLDALKELAYGASHEINNPLANIAARAQTLLEDETDPERRRKLAAIHRQALRAHEMVADLMLFARPPRLNRVPCDPRAVVQKVLAEHADDAAAREIELTGRFPGGEVFEVLADQTQLAVALDALLTNALEAVGAGGRVEIAVRLKKGSELFLQSDAASSYSFNDKNSSDPFFVEFLVTDDGPGISENVRRHMFDPFFSGREAGRGLGFGLSKCWRIVTDHGGRVVVHATGGRGAEIAIRLPAAE